MTASLRTHVLCGTALASALLLVACGKHGPENPNRTPAPTSTTPTAAVASTVARSPVASASTLSKPTTSTPVATMTPLSAPAPAASAPLGVAKVTLGNKVGTNFEVTGASNSFPDDSKIIYASVDTHGSSSSAMLNAKWSYLEGKGQLVSNVSQSIATDGPAVTTFKVENPNLWPDGRYQVEISLDGKPVSTQAFLIHKR